MANIKFFYGNDVPVELHKVRVIQKLNLISIDKRLEAIKKAGNNTFLLKNEDVFLDMLTDSGVNAMSDNQIAAMMKADDSYAGSMTFTHLEQKIEELFGTPYYLPAHQGRACENIISQVFVKEGSVIPMNYHFTTTKSHIMRNGGKVVELVSKEGLEVNSDCLFKGNFDLEALNQVISETGAENIPFLRIELGTNLIGGQPISLENIEKTVEICKASNILVVMDFSLLTDNLYFIKTREDACKDMSIREITLKISDFADIIYFSARKLGSARGGGICTKNIELYNKMKELVPLYEGFLTYGGMSVREMEAMTVGLDEAMDMDMISHGPEFIAYMVEEFTKAGVPVITPGGGLGCHINAMDFVSHIPQNEYPAGALAAAIFLCGSIRGMERGTISEERNEDGSEKFADMELVRLALPRRVFTLSQVKYAVDRICWLYKNRHLIGGLKFSEEPKILRFFLGRLEPVSDWQEKLVEEYKKDFPDSL